MGQNPRRDFGPFAHLSSEKQGFGILRDVRHLVASIWSIICLKVSKDWAPTSGFPFRMKEGVLCTPICRATALCCWTVCVYLPESRHWLKAVVSRPKSAANFFRLSLLNVPLFSPFWLAKSLSWYSQNLFWSLAHSLASAAHCDSSPRKA